LSDAERNLFDLYACKVTHAGQAGVTAFNPAIGTHQYFDRKDTLAGWVELVVSGKSRLDSTFIPQLWSAEIAKSLAAGKLIINLALDAE
jgi:hypothetical protein